ncbi:MAG TPA: CPBP family intramembrane glutamic endopeptidase [Acidobacteriota bacterium]|nr:CPBP family intramembrane glutamic endopeptidase [Acidobacteriota bacterium]
MRGEERFLRRFRSAFQVAAVAVFGQVAASLVLGLPDPGRLEVHRGHLFAFLLLESLFTLLLIFFFLRWEGQGWKDIGWRRSRAFAQALKGILSVPLLLLAAYLVIRFFAEFLPRWSSLENPLLQLIKGPLDLFFFLLSSLAVGGFKEEIQRAFVLERFGRDLGGVWLGLALWSLFFGALHLLQGPDKAAAAAVLGAIFGFLYLQQRHLAAPIAAHALYDMTVVVWAYLGSSA